MGDWNNNDINSRHVGLTGRLPVKVTNENGPIRVGDFLTSSSKPGVAMKCPTSTADEKIKCFGATIGKALEPCDQNECRILAVITLQ